MTVTQSSATDHWKHSREADDMIPLDSNHIDLVKFDHPRDPKYLTVQRRIHEMIKAAPKVVKKRFPEPVVPSST